MMRLGGLRHSITGVGSAVEGAWGWVPCAPRAEYVGGAVYVRPVYAPALVAWVGGPGFGIGVAVGGGGGVGVGWFPLGPREVYVPAYHVSRAYVENVNVSNTRVSTTVVNNYYTNVVVNKNVNVTNVTYVQSAGTRRGSQPYLACKRLLQANPLPRIPFTRGCPGGRFRSRRRRHSSGGAAA